MLKRLMMLVVVLALAGCSGKPAGKPLPVRLPVPSCAPAAGHAQMGASLRCRVTALPPVTLAPPGQTGLDLSNNNPVYGLAAWRQIRRHDSFVYLKVNEGTSYRDPTAARMAHDARAAGLFVGGYDFQHVCATNPVSEARVAIAAARTDGLAAGHGVLPLVADFELAYGTCNRTAWLNAWTATVRRTLGRAAVYSDPGFYAPSVGCFTSADVGWVADLGGYVSLCRLATVLHQYSFAAADGVGFADGDVYLGSYRQLQALAGASPAPKPRKPTPGARRLAKLVKRRDRLRVLEARHACRARHHTYRACVRWLPEGAALDHLIHSLGGH